MHSEHIEHSLVLAIQEFKFVVDNLFLPAPDKKKLIDGAKRIAGLALTYGGSTAKDALVGWLRSME